MVVAFEGETALGTRHAHILVHVPTPLKKCSRSMLMRLFPGQFRLLWHKTAPPTDHGSYWRLQLGLQFGRANTARKIYAVKSVQGIEVPWSRFEFVTPPKTNKFQNENLSVIRNRDQQRRIALGKIT